MNIEKGDVIQLDPAKHARWAAGLLMIVAEVKSWGVTCYAMLPTEPTGIVPYRAETGSFERIGKTVWLQVDQ